MRVTCFILILVLLTACSTGENVQEFVDGYDVLLKELQTKEYQIIEEVQANNDVLRGNNRVIHLKGDIMINVYTYDENNTLKEDKAGIIDDGFTISIKDDENNISAHYSWVSTPHFFHCGDSIILYVGTDTDLINLIDDIGDQINN